MAVAIPDLEATRISLLQRIRKTLRKRKFPLDGSLAPAFERFETWMRGYRCVPDEVTLRAKLVEFGVFQLDATADSLIEALARPLEESENFEDIIPNLPPVTPSPEVDLKRLDEASD